MKNSNKSNTVQNTVLEPVENLNNNLVVKTKKIKLVPAFQAGKLELPEQHKRFKYFYGSSEKTLLFCVKEFIYKVFIAVNGNVLIYNKLDGNKQFVFVDYLQLNKIFDKKFYESLCKEYAK
jgi:hypothetical protein